MRPLLAGKAYGYSDSSGLQPRRASSRRSGHSHALELPPRGLRLSLPGFCGTQTTLAAVSERPSGSGVAYWLDLRQVVIAGRSGLVFGSDVAKNGCGWAERAERDPLRD